MQILFIYAYCQEISNSVFPNLKSPQLTFPRYRTTKVGFSCSSYYRFAAPPGRFPFNPARMHNTSIRWWLVLLIAPNAALAIIRAMSCGYGPRGSLTAICINATAPFFKLTTYRFDHLDETLVCVNCTLFSLETSTFDIPGNQIKTLDIRNSSINAIHSRAFLGMIHMEKLLLSHNHIHEIYKGAFEGIRKVKYLEMENALMGFHSNADVFRELHLLEVLDLKSNLLTGLHPATFEGLHNLRMLDLSHNNLLALEPDVFKPLVNLRVLVLNDNSISTVFGYEFVQLRRLTTVNMARNGMSNCSIGLGPGNSLMILNLADNFLSSDSFQPGAFENLTNLEDLDLSKNRFGNLTPKAFRGMYKLTTLNLAENMLQGIDTGCFSGLPHLRVLNVSHNKLESLKITGKLRMDNLVQIDLSNNNITSFDYLSLVARAPRLRYVNLRSNNFLSCSMEDQLKTLFLQDHVMALVSHVERDCPNVTTESGEELLYELRKEYQDPYISSTLLVWMFVLVTVAMLLVGVLFYVQFFILLGMGGQSSRNVRLLRNFASTEVSDV